MAVWEISEGYIVRIIWMFSEETVFFFRRLDYRNFRMLSGHRCESILLKEYERRTVAFHGILVPPVQTQFILNME